jgi:serine/threonine protein kinase
VFELFWVIFCFLDKILKPLPRGNGGNVYLAEDLNTHEIVVIKSSLIPDDESKKKKVDAVNSAWKAISSPYVVKFIDSFNEGSMSCLSYCLFFLFHSFLSD